MSGISFSGVGSGVDTKLIVNSLVSSEIQPQRQALDTRRKSFDAQISAIGRLKSSLTEFNTALQNLNSADKFQARSVTQSSENNFKASARPTAQPGSYQVSVEQLARSQVLISENQAFSSAQDVVGNGSVTISLGGAFDSELNNGFTLNFDSEDTTLQDVARAINRAPDNNQVSASIVNVDDGQGGTQARLMLTSLETGTANEINIAVTEGSQPGLSFLNNMDESRSAEDAVIKVNGLTATRSSNEIGDVIQGVTLNLTQADEGVETTITVGTDLEAIEKNVKSFVDAYNKVQGVLRDMTSKDDSVLRSDSTVRMLSSQLRSISSSTVDTGDPQASLLAQIGVSVDRDGRMSLDKSELSEQLDRNFNSVADLFASEEGVAKRLSDLVRPYTQTGGLLDNRTDSLNTRLRGVSDQEERIDRSEELLFNRLTRQFNAMDSMVAQMNSNGAFLNAQLASLV